MSQRITPPGWKPAKAYSYARQVRDTLYVAGVLPCDPSTQEVLDERFEAQWELVWRNLREILSAVDMSPADVVVLRIYVTDISAYEAADGRALAEGWQAVFGTHLPAVTMVQVGALTNHRARIEVEAEAVQG